VTRRALVVVVVVLAVLLAFDTGMRFLAQYWVGRELKESLLLEERPGVSLGGFPFTVRLVAGTFPTVDVEARGFQDASLRIQRIRVHLVDASVPRRQLLSGSEGRIRARRGSGSAHLTGDDATAAIQARGVPLRIRFEGDRALVSVQELPGQVAARLSLSEDGRSIRVGAADLPLSGAVSLPLPGIVRGLRYTDVRVEAGLLVVDFELSDVSFDVA
jgi:LmeA-like phospholipid-binding